MLSPVSTRPSSHICSAVDAAWFVCGGVAQTVVRLRSWLHARLQQLLASSGHLDLGCRHQPGHAILTPTLHLACNLHTVQYTLYKLYCSTLGTLGQSRETRAVHKRQPQLYTSHPTRPTASIPCMLWFGGMGTKPLPDKTHCVKLKQELLSKWVGLR